MNKQVENIIEKALREEPSFQLRKGFADRMVLLVRKKERASQRKIYFWIALGSMFIVGAGVGILIYYFPTFYQLVSSGQGFTGMIPIAVLIGILIVVIEFIDKKLVRDKIISSL